MMHLTFDVTKTQLLIIDACEHELQTSSVLFCICTCSEA